MSARRLLARIVALSSLTLLLGGGCMRGCVEFDGQTIESRHDAERDTLDVLLIDRGLHATQGDVEHAVEQLQAARGRRVFAVITTLITFDLDGAVAETQDDGTLAAQIRASLHEAEVHDLGFWVDATGRLCAAQHVRIPHVETALQQMSESFVAWLVAHDRDLEELAESCGLTEPGDVTALRAALAANPAFPLVQLRGSALAFSLPLDDALWQRGRVFALHGLADLESRANAGDPSACAIRDLLLASDVALLREGERAMILVGNPGRATAQLELPARDSRGADLVPALRALGWTISGPDGETAARSAFAAAVAPR